MLLTRELFERARTPYGPPVAAPRQFDRLPAEQTMTWKGRVGRDQLVVNRERSNRPPGKILAVIGNGHLLCDAVPGTSTDEFGERPDSLLRELSWQPEVGALSVRRSSVRLLDIRLLDVRRNKSPASTCCWRGD